MENNEVDYSQYSDEEYSGPVVYYCEKCKKYYVSGGMCPVCVHSPLLIEPISRKVYNGMLFRGELYTK